MKNLLKISILGLLICCFTACIYYQRYPMAKKRLFKLKDQSLSFYLIDPSRPLSGMWYVHSYDFREKDMTLKMSRISEREAIAVTNIGSKQDARLSKNDVLIYIKPPEARNFTDSLTTKLSYDQLERVEVYETNFGKSVSMSFVGYVTVGLVLAALVTGGFCQSVYAVNPADCPLQGELFAGAAWSNAIRTEYLQLPDIKPRDDVYTIRLAGKNGQVQHLDELGMYAIAHPVGTKAIVDRQGKAQVISTLVKPSNAIDNLGNDATPLLTETDGQYWPTFQETIQGKSSQSLELSFPKPQGAKSARLYIKAKNSLWLDAIFNEYRIRFPHALPSGNSPKNEIDHWLHEQQIPLSVSILDQHNQWQLTGFFSPNGTLQFRDDVLEIDLAKHEGNGIRIKINCGFQFWELDYAAMDFSMPNPVDLSRMPRHGAPNEKLAMADGIMLTLDHFNDDVLLSFQAPPPCPAGMQYSIFARGTGFYSFSSVEKNAKTSPKKDINLSDYSLRKWQAYCKIKT